ncbi:MAG: hydrogenase small subunit [Dehalococcoidales bacterium]
MDTLLRPKPTRREFLQVATASLALLGLSQALSPRVVKALEDGTKKPSVVWLHGQECTGCSESFVNSIEPTAASLILDTISLRYHETIMAASGHHAEQALNDAIKEGGYLLVIEGSIPLAEDGLYCQVGGRTFKDIVRECASKAAAVIPIGACATFGGLNSAGPTDAVGYLYRNRKKHHEFDDVTGNKPVINLPCCPMHPERLVAVIVHYLTFGTIPPLDNFERPIAFYGELQHDNCERRGQFEAGHFVTDFGDPSQNGYCLYLKGCKGPWTRQDCWKRKWNGQTNYCIGANAPCVGCSEPDFYERFSPLYDRQFDVTLPGVGKADIDTVFATVAAIAAAGIGIDTIITKLKGDES